MAMNSIVGQKLSLAIDQELARMSNEWFHKWHYIGGDESVEIDSFQGKLLRFGGVSYFGSPEKIFWSTLTIYCRIKIQEYFEFVESQINNYPVKVREKTIDEACGLIKMFVTSIRQSAVEKDRILRGDGMEFPKARDRGKWKSCDASTIDAQARALIETYCDNDAVAGGKIMSKTMMNEKLSFVKSDGSGLKNNIKGLVSGNRVFTYDVSLPVQPHDRFLRQLPSGLVEEYIVEDPGYQAAVGSAIEPHFQAKVRRSDTSVAPAQTIINNIQGENARVNIDSVDSSQNTSVTASDNLIFQELREKAESAIFNEAEKEKILNSIDQMKVSHGTPEFKVKYQNFMALAANHASIFGALLAGLAMLV